MIYTATVKVAGGRSIELRGEEVEHPFGARYGTEIEWNFEELRDELKRLADLDRASEEYDDAVAE